MAVVIFNAKKFMESRQEVLAATNEHGYILFRRDKPHPGPKPLPPGYRTCLKDRWRGCVSTAVFGGLLCLTHRRAHL